MDESQGKGTEDPDFAPLCRAKDRENRAPHRARGAGCSRAIPPRNHGAKADRGSSNDIKGHWSKLSPGPQASGRKVWPCPPFIKRLGLCRLEIIRTKKTLRPLTQGHSIIGADTTAAKIAPWDYYKPAAFGPSERVRVGSGVAYINRARSPTSPPKTSRPGGRAQDEDPSIRSDIISGFIESAAAPDTKT